MISLEIITFLATGLLLGLKHALDSDHLIAVSTIISENHNKSSSALKGAVWGLGHTFTLFLVGIFVLFLKLNITEKMAAKLEIFVGFLLVYLGLSLLRKIRKNNIHIHSHIHDGNQHLHLHSHKDEKSHQHLHKSFLVGSIHGLAGSAALMLIVLTTAKTEVLGIFFILIFGLGSIITMVIFGYLASIPLRLTEIKVNSFNKLIKLSVAGISTFIGLSIILHTI